MKNKNTYIAIGIICVVLASAITLQVRTMKREGSAVSLSFANSELKDSLLEWKEKSERAQFELEQSTKKLEEIRKASTQNGENSSDKQAELKRYNMLLGLTDVSGNGITLTVSDSSGESGLIDMSSLIVHDTDLRSLVNELANAGAEAIEINGQRIVNSTYIMCAGNVILVNGEKISSPCVIKAIGNQASLYGALERAGGTIQQMRMNKVQVETKKVNNIEIAKYNGAITQKYMKTK